MIIEGKLCKFVSLYRSPNQSQDDSESFANNFELNIYAVLFELLLLVISISGLIFGLREIGDFNIRSNLWFKGDKASYEGY